MNNIAIYCTLKGDDATEGYYSFTTYREGKAIRITIDSRLPVAKRFPGMKEAIHKAEELNKAGYETQLMMIL